MTRLKLEGKKFGRLTVIKELPSKNYKIQWLCLCDCGNYMVTKTNLLNSGKTKSCGCLAGETASKNFTTHGGRKTRLYNIWNGMKSRCYNMKSPRFIDYGGRGITICDEWEDFQVFRDWAMKNGYEDDLTIDRIDVNGNYEPLNCRWIPKGDQAKNRRPSNEWRRSDE